MHYQVSRNGQTYGPYTLEDIQRYVASGNVLPTDMAKSEEMPDWVPVSMLLGQTAPVAPPPAMGFATPGYADVSTGAAFSQPVSPIAPAAANAYADAPNLPWGLYLLFSIITCGYFSIVFTCVQAAWLKKVQPNSLGLIGYIATYVVFVIRKWRNRLVGGAYLAAIQHHDIMGLQSMHPVAFALPLTFIYFAMLIGTRFVMRQSLQEHFNTVEPIGLKLDPVMTFFFGGVYFQHQINRINAMKQASRYNAGQRY
jgi:hypothetical protein